MNTNILKILFVIERFKVNKQGKAPIKCRITYLGQRKPFSTGLFINPDNWNASKQKVFPTTTDNNHLNTQLSLIKQEINQAFLMLQVQLETFDVEDIYKEINRLKDEGFVVLNEIPKKGADNKLVAFLHPKGTNGVLIELCQEIA